MKGGMQTERWMHRVKVVNKDCKDGYLDWKYGREGKEMEREVLREQEGKVNARGNGSGSEGTVVVWNRRKKEVSNEKKDEGRG